MLKNLKIILLSSLALANTYASGAIDTDTAAAGTSRIAPNRLVTVSKITLNSPYDSSMALAIKVLADSAIKNGGRFDTLDAVAGESLSSQFIKVLCSFLKQFNTVAAEKARLETDLRTLQTGSAADREKAAADMARLNAELEALQTGSAADREKAAADMARLNTELEALQAKSTSDSAAAASDMARLQDELATLRAKANADNEAAAAEKANLEAKLAEATSKLKEHDETLAAQVADSHEVYNYLLASLPELGLEHLASSMEAMAPKGGDRTAAAAAHDKPTVPATSSTAPTGGDGTSATTAHDKPAVPATSSAAPTSRDGTSATTAASASGNPKGQTQGTVPARRR